MKFNTVGFLLKIFMEVKLSLITTAESPVKSCLM